MLLLASTARKKSEVIRDVHGEYPAFADIIMLASSNRHIKLARRAGLVMQKIENVSELAARHPAQITLQKDIDEQRLGLRRLINPRTRFTQRPERSRNLALIPRAPCREGATLVAKL